MVTKQHCTFKISENDRAVSIQPRFNRISYTVISVSLEAMNQRCSVAHIFLYSPIYIYKIFIIPFNIYIYIYFKSVMSI